VGLRYAAIAYLLAAALGAVAWSALPEPTAVGSCRRPRVGVALFALSCAYGVRGIFEVQVTKRDLQAFDRRCAAPAARSLPISGGWLRPDANLRQRGILHLAQWKRPGLWLDRAGSREKAFLYATYSTPPDK